ncbi:class I SAM-dependent methyltransferase [Lichenibacterium ramalinae]|uniref:Class I SAM-dependent methyltransferase n=1 Tax=Lichenibacterium ramalinae TaxID=2316527 RepID=A0A4Q2R6I8_9HYPH|nr:class I SAM-dependent methyltransferase [Lichenibacterium ramalinae]RYB02198.1 class I SAM-dependent methyltransferase [Lichenibacterium ramalinae]
MNLREDQRRWLADAQAQWNDVMQPGAQPLGTHLFGPPLSPPDAAMASARLFATRSAALHALPRGGAIAELGTQAGRYARQILDVCQPEALHLFDLEFDTLRAKAPEVAADPRVHLHVGDSSTNLEAFPDRSFDWIYIDGDHSEGGVQRDASCGAGKIRDDGLLVFNNYTVWSPLELTDYGILPVVNRMLASGEWEVAYLALHPLMYCDIALRRPGRD